MSDRDDETETDDEDGSTEDRAESDEEPEENRQDLWAAWRHETDHQFNYNDR